MKIPGFKETVFKQGFKLSLAKEQLINMNSNDALNFLKAINDTEFKVLNRKKCRTSFIQYLNDNDNNQIPVFKIDLTQVSSFVNTKETSHSENTFEIEYEYIGNHFWDFLNGSKTFTNDNKKEFSNQLHSYMHVIAEIFVDTLKYLLANIQKSPVLLDVDKHNAVFIEYLKLVGLYDGREEYSLQANKKRDVFIGCQPESLHFRDIPILLESPYLIWDKSDGERMLMLILNKSIYMIDRFMHIVKTTAQLTVNELGKKPRSSIGCVCCFQLTTFNLQLTTFKLSKFTKLSN